MAPSGAMILLLSLATFQHPRSYRYINSADFDSFNLNIEIDHCVINLLLILHWHEESANREQSVMIWLHNIACKAVQNLALCGVLLLVLVLKHVSFVNA
ncbi:hypothetical protein EDC04DRAFT_447695 [Pisolithus marmoratus]|nr:hypothetical protein EDC04DRAFT_447695 [Pisolithus marmoratus]